MKPMISNMQCQTLVKSLLVGLCILGVIGCPRSTQTPDNRKLGVNDIKIVPQQNGSAIELNAAAVYDIMSRCGFTDQQIYFHGTALRDALKNYGRAVIFIGDKAEVLLSVYGEEVRGISMTYSYFVYDAKACTFKLGAAPKPKRFAPPNPDSSVNQPSL